MLRLRNALLHGILLVSITSLLPPEMRAGDGEDMPSVDQIVDRMREHEAHQSKQLKHYEAVRHYYVQYKGFATTLAANMTVEVNYDEASGKSFRILSQSGSKLLCDKVLKRAVESEKEASQDRQSTALTSANYHFRLTGTEWLEGRPTYILHVDPLRDGKFLYRGSVWVDAAEYAVHKLEVEPAKNPSFWIASSEIENTNSDTQGIWLPQKNRSESRIRVGGIAVLTIDYGIYRIDLTSQAQSQASQAVPLGAKVKVTEAASSQLK
jgi:hypothetical protein